ncbi:hypothetical protein [Streptomyces sp. 7N604]|uniref:hypothetical protein n=1 Tax=Streptomyces sp. 7N604 TaxID=3457415 RepID=UPI003FD03AAA
MDTTHLAVDGFVDAVPTPGPRDTVQFELIASPADDGTGDTDTDTVFACITGDPFITYALLTEIQPRDLLRVSGTVVQLEHPGEAARLTVDALEVLAAAQLPVLHETVLTATARTSAFSTSTVTMSRSSPRTAPGLARRPAPTRSAT